MIVYIAAPYGRSRGLPEKEIENNVQRAILYARMLISKGHTPIIPHLYHYVATGWEASPGEDTFLHIGRQLLELSDAVLRLSGESQGADEEMALAKSLFIPVYNKIEEIENGG